MQIINVSQPNDNLGSALRDAMIITNSNFVELDLGKATLVNGKIQPSQLPTQRTITVSLDPPSGTPADGDQWIRYIN